MKIVYQHENSGAWIEEACINYAIPVSTIDGYSDSEFHTDRCRELSVVSKDGSLLKHFTFHNIWMRKGKAAQRMKQIDEVIKWLSAYWYLAKYKPRVAPGCNLFIEHPRQACPNLHAGKDGMAKCSISPFSHGYSGGLDIRNVPEDHICDVFVISSYYDSQLAGSPLSMREVWRCWTGEAIKEFERKGHRSLELGTIDLVHRR